MRLFSRIIKSATDFSRFINFWNDSSELSHLITLPYQLEVIVPIIAVYSTLVSWYVRVLQSTVRTDSVSYTVLRHQNSKQNRKQCKIIKNSRNRTVALMICYLS